MSDNKIVNDLSIQVATVNGSGSQSANNIIIKTLFRMGIPVGGKNIFPSNIAGLPTWYNIRANKHGYIARKHDVDLIIAMNQDTIDEDIRNVPDGSSFSTPVIAAKAAELFAKGDTMDQVKEKLFAATDTVEIQPEDTPYNVRVFNPQLFSSQ